MLKMLTFNNWPEQGHYTNVEFIQPTLARAVVTKDSKDLAMGYGVTEFDAAVDAARALRDS